jgi:hypothetical protein
MVIGFRKLVVPLAGETVKVPFVGVMLIGTPKLAVAQTTTAKNISAGRRPKRSKVDIELTGQTIRTADGFGLVSIEPRNRAYVQLEIPLTTLILSLRLKANSALKCPFRN